MTGNEKIKRHAELAETTRAIIGRTTVPAYRLTNIDTKAGTATLVKQGVAFDAVLWKDHFMLTGDYTIVE